MKIAPFSLSAAAGFLLVSFCVAAQAEPLADAVQSALRTNPKVTAAVANRDAYEEERHENWAGYFPQLSVDGTGGRIYGDNSTSRGLSVTRDAAYSWLWEGSATLSQPIFDGFQTVNKVAASDDRIRSAEFNILDVREQVALKTAMSYLDVMRGEEAQERIGKHEGKLADYQKRIQNMVNEGGADKAMIVQAKDIRAQLDNTLANVEGQTRTAQADYRDLVGHLPEGKLTMPEPRLDLIPKTADEAVALALKSHPSLRAARSNENALERDADAERQYYYPKVHSELSYLKRDQDDRIGGEVVDARAVIRANWALSFGGADRARMRKQLERYEEGKAQRADTERQVEHQVRAAYNDYETAQKQLAILQDRTQLNRELFKTYKTQFEASKINLLQLQQAENATFNAELAQMNAQYRLRAAAFAVLASMGRLQDSLAVAPVQAAAAELPAPPIAAPAQDDSLGGKAAEGQ
jgi:adhesin transport system outer membrane protein